MADTADTYQVSAQLQVHWCASLIAHFTCFRNEINMNSAEARAKHNHAQNFLNSFLVKHVIKSFVMKHLLRLLEE